MCRGPVIHIQYLTVGAIIWSLVLISGNSRRCPWQRYPSSRFSSLGFKHLTSVHFCVAHFCTWNSLFSQHSAYFFLWPFLTAMIKGRRTGGSAQDGKICTSLRIHWPLPISMLNSASSSSVARLLWRLVSYSPPTPVFNPNPCPDIFDPNRSSFSGPLFIPGLGTNIERWIFFSNKKDFWQKNMKGVYPDNAS